MALPPHPSLQLISDHRLILNPADTSAGFLFVSLPHPEERALARVSNEGWAMGLMVRDAAQVARLLTMRGNVAAIVSAPR
jgi:hypothetical protein